MRLYEFSATELSSMLKEKKISAVELTKDIFNRIDEIEDKINAYITLNKENALEKARQIDEKRAKNEILSDIAGLPIAVKDNICTENILTTCGSKMLYNFIPPYNATVIEKLNKNDAIIIGKTNMDEFAMGSSTETSYYKKTHNPFDLDRVPGGSSGGSAASVASGEAILSLGSDTGGSIRQPASLCGLFGLKPTYGTVSRYGLVAFASSLDQIGPFAKSTKDLALFYNHLIGKDENDATSVDYNFPNYLDCFKNNIQGLKVGIAKEYFETSIDNIVKNKTLTIAELLEKNGAKLVDLSIPSVKGALADYYIIACAEASSNLARFDGVKYGFRSNDCKNIEELFINSRSEGFGDEVKRRILLGTMVLSSGFSNAFYKRAKVYQQKIKKDYYEAFSKCDLLLTPTSPFTAFKIGEKFDDPLKMYAADICTLSCNIATIPGLNLPIGFSNEGLPIGAQLLGPRFSEDLLFNVSDYIENAISFKFSVPKI